MTFNVITFKADAPATSQVAPSIRPLDRNRPVTLTVNTIAGGGKTYAALDHAATMARTGARTVVAQPSTRLIEQSYNDLVSRHPDITATRITGDTHAGKVTQAIIQHGRSAASRDGEVLLISHAALLRLPWFHRQADWGLIVDEAPSATASIEVLDMPSGLVRCLEIKPHNLVYSTITARYKEPLKRIAAGRAGERLKPFAELAGLILSKRQDVYALSSQVLEAKRLLAGRVSFYATLRSTALAGWRSTTIMSACLEDTLLHRLWTLDGMQWQDASRISKNLRATEHRNGNLLTIHYATEQDWSKRLRDRQCGDGDVLEEMMVASLRLFDGRPHVFLINRDREDMMVGIDGADQLPNTSHGLNSYQHIDCAVAYSALNLTPAHLAFLQSRGVEPEAARASVYYSAAYQAAMRISLRDLSSKSTKLLVVPDRGCAEYIAARFPGSRIQLLDSAIMQQPTKPSGRPRVRADDAEKSRVARANKSKALIASVNALNESVSARNTDTKPLYLFSSFVSESAAENDFVGFDVFADIYATTPAGVWPYGNTDDFIADLRDRFHPVVLERKDQNHLISPAHFDPDLCPDKSRGRENVVYANGIWLDNDGGDLTPDDFAALFRHLRVVCYNSFSSTAAKPKYRVYIPTSHLMTAEVYLAITRQIMSVLHQAGYRDTGYLKKDPKCRFKNHGFDVTKTHPENLFYLPCQPANPSGWIWLDFNSRDRHPLDVMAAIEHTITPETPEPERLRAVKPIVEQPLAEGTSEAKRRAHAALIAARDNSAVVRTMQIEAAVNEWRCSLPGEGNAAFFKLAVSLRRSGLPPDDVRLRLEQEAMYGNSPRERLRAIPGIIKRMT